MPATYEPIATTTLTGTSSLITFSSIPATYTDLRVVFVFKGAGNTLCEMRLNNDSSALYSTVLLYGDGSSVIAGQYNNYTETGGENGFMPNGIFGIFEVDLFGYSNSSYFKSMIISKSMDTNGTTLQRVIRQTSLYRSTSAINRIDLLSGGIPFGADSTATVYGIKDA